MEAWLEILLRDIKRLVRGPSTSRKLFFILKGFEVDLCGMEEKEQQRILK